MKQKNKIKKLRARISGYDEIQKNLKGDSARASGYHKPGSLKD